MTTPLAIAIGAGGTTAVGRTLRATAAATRAGIAGFTEHPYLVDSAGEPMRLARAGWLPADCADVDRFTSLVLPAIEEALGSPLRPRGRVGLALALPSDRPGLPPDLKRELLSRIEARVGAVDSLGTFESGHAAGYAALEWAVHELSCGVIDSAVVAGVDSYASPEALEWLDRRDQLHGGGMENNAWGFVPGEGAGALLLVRPDDRRPAPAGAIAVLGIGTGHESHLIGSGEVCVGQGLTAAFRTALALVVPHGRIADVYCDLNGEPYRSDEYGFTVLRTKEWFRNATAFVAPADCWGDVGAASACLHIGLAMVAHTRRYARGTLSFSCASSEEGLRGAAVIGAGGVACP